MQSDRRAEVATRQKTEIENRIAPAPRRNRLARSPAEEEKRSTSIDPNLSRRGALVSFGGVEGQPHRTLTWMSRERCSAIFVRSNPVEAGSGRKCSVAIQSVALLKFEMASDRAQGPKI